MVHTHRWLDVLAHVVLITGVIIIAFPVYIAFIASTLGYTDFVTGQLPLLPGPHLIENIKAVFSSSSANNITPPIGPMLFNSLVMALAIALGKIAISSISAFAIVYFRFPLRMLAFWIIFLTLMLPVEVRIMPTYKVVADLGLLNTYTGLSVPLIASATATFLFRQVFLTMPDELTEAARIDGAGPMKFFRDILMPLSRTNIAALFVIMFIYGWNQFLWPLLITTDPKFYTVVMGVKRMAQVLDSEPQWQMIMTAVIIAMLPPILVIILMQKLFVKGLVETEK